MKTLKVGGKTDHLGTLGPKEKNGGVSLVFLLPHIPKTWIGRSQQLGNAMGMDPKQSKTNKHNTESLLSLIKKTKKGAA